MKMASAQAYEMRSKSLFLHCAMEFCTRWHVHLILLLERDHHAGFFRQTFFFKKKPCWMCGSRRMHPIMMDPLRFHSFWGDSSGTWLQKTFSFWSADKWEFLLRGAMWSHCFFKATRFSGAMKRLSDNWSSGISIQLFLLCRFCSA